MEGELGSGARIAIALIVIGVIISVIFVILGFTRSTTNTGITTVQNSMDSMSLAQFDDYDQKIMSGTQVTSAIKLFEGRPVAIVVRTALQLTATAGSGHNYGALLGNITEEDETEDTVISFVNSTAIAETEIPQTPTEYAAYFRANLNTTNGIQYNFNKYPTTQTGTNTYVRPTAKFLAKLIKDDTDAIVGIGFTQQ